MYLCTFSNIVIAIFGLKLTVYWIRIYKEKLSTRTFFGNTLMFLSNAILLLVGWFFCWFGCFFPFPQRKGFWSHSSLLHGNFRLGLHNFRWQRKDYLSYQHIYPGTPLGVITMVAHISLPINIKSTQKFVGIITPFCLFIYSYFKISQSGGRKNLCSFSWCLKTQSVIKYLFYGTERWWLL